MKIQMASDMKDAGSNAKRWMLMDDNRDVLLMLSALAKTLTRAEIECYSAPEEALAAFAAASEQYELVITDYEMPGMNGIELCRRIRQARPGQKIFLATGSGYFTSAAARFAGFNALLEKPFPLAVLKKALADNFVAPVNYCSIALLPV